MENFGIKYKRVTYTNQINYSIYIFVQVPESHLVSSALDDVRQADDVQKGDDDASSTHSAQIGNLVNINKCAYKFYFG